MRRRERGALLGPHVWPILGCQLLAVSAPKDMGTTLWPCGLERPFHCTGAARLLCGHGCPGGGTSVCVTLVSPSSKQLEKQGPILRGRSQLPSRVAGDGAGSCLLTWGRMTGAPFHSGVAPGWRRTSCSSGWDLGLKSRAGSPGKTLPGDTRCLKGAFHHNDTPAAIFRREGLRQMAYWKERSPWTRRRTPRQAGPRTPVSSETGSPGHQGGTFRAGAWSQ